MVLTIHLSKEVADLSEAQGIVAQVKVWLDSHPGFTGAASVSTNLTDELKDGS